MAKKLSPLDIMNTMGDAADKKAKAPKGQEMPEEKATPKKKMPPKKK